MTKLDLYLYCNNIYLVKFLSLNYNGSWEGFFRWSALYGVSDSFVGYPYDSVYLLSLFLAFSSSCSTLFISLPAFFSLFLLLNLYNLYYVTTPILFSV